MIFGDSEYKSDMALDYQKNGKYWYQKYLAELDRVRRSKRLLCEYQENAATAYALARFYIGIENVIE